MSKVERSPSLKEQILNILRKDFIKGKFKPGDHIVESEIARKFGTSRGPVREALVILENEGFLTRSENGNIFVTTLTKKDLYEIYSLRSLIEGFAAKLAVPNFSEEDIAYLNKCLNNIAELKGSLNQSIAVPNTLEIHRFVIVKSDHKRLIDLWQNLDLQLKMLGSVVMVFDTVEGTLIKHSQLIRALITKDPNIAEKAITEHIMEAWKIADQYINMEDELK
ncbi:MAG: hypothetical protein VR72_20590 [Clostridiaceae bacterium BRH_c20a]|nr:MAG: hypothetical protein VR72_20590 [Clostridiaceae bacterium BRH_c20a]